MSGVIGISSFWADTCHDHVQIVAMESYRALEAIADELDESRDGGTDVAMELPGVTVLWADQCEQRIEAVLFRDYLVLQRRLSDIVLGNNTDECIDLRTPTRQEVGQALITLLERDCLIPGLASDETYTRLQDDRDGETGTEHQLMIHVACDGDMHVFGADGVTSLRFRNYFGGGRSHRTHRALRLLAEAIRRDNLSHP